MKVRKVALFGGVGNKLFQIAHGKYLCQKGFEVVFVDFSYKESSLVNALLRWTKHKDWLNLENVFTKEKFIYPSLAQELLFIIEYIILRIIRKEGLIFNFDIGYYQSIKGNHSESIAWVADKIKKNLNKKEYSSQSIIHFRGKDFTYSEKEYQIEIIRQVINQEKELSFSLVSDDADTFYEKFSDKKIKNLSSNQLNDFITIMNAKNIILSDSTFAFWALLAGHNSNKKYYIGKKNLYLIDAFMKHVAIKVF